LGIRDDGHDRKMLIGNGLGETLTLVDRTDGVWKVSQDILPIGQGVSQMLIRNGICYIMNALSNSIQIVDPVKLKTIGEISLGAGTNPEFMDFVDDRTAVVSCYLTNEVVLVDLSPAADPHDRILARIPLPSGDRLPHDPGIPTAARPGGIAALGDQCYVACANLSMMHVAGGPGLLVEIDLTSRSVKTIYELSGRDTTGLLHSDRFPNRLIITSAGDYTLGEGFKGNGTVESLNILTGEIFQVVGVDGAPLAGTIGPDDILFLENAMEGKLLRVDLHEGKALPSFALPSWGEPLSFASSILPLPGLLCVTDFNSDRLYLLDGESGQTLAELAAGDGPDAMVEIE
jgi:hypothetical protein